MRRAAAFRGLAALLAALLALPPALPAEEGTYPPLLIGPGDMLNITVYGEKDLPTAYLVDSSGEIVFPMVGVLGLSGKTQAEAGELLGARLGVYLRKPQVTVLIAETAQYTISVLGHVARPGKYRIRGLPNLLGAVAEAGGPLPHAALSSAVLVRGRQRTPLDLGCYLSGSGADLKEQPLLYPGDVVYIPQSPWPTIGEWGVIVGIVSTAVLLSFSLSSR